MCEREKCVREREKCVCEREREREFVYKCVCVCVCVCVYGGYIPDSKMGKQGGSNYGVFQVHLISP